MQFIDKKSLTNLISIPPKYQLIIKNPDSYTHEETQDLFLFLMQHKDKYWIQCNCHIPHALLIICSMNNKIYIKTKVKKDHLQSCHFFLINNVNITNNQDKGMCSRLMKYNLYSVQLQFQQNNEIEYQQKRFGYISRLGQALYTAFHDSKVNIISTKQINISILSQLTSITASFEDTNKIIYKNIPLSKFYRYSLTPESLSNAESFLVKATYWLPPHLIPFMLFTAIASKITRNSFTIKKGTFTFNLHNNISLPSQWINKDKSAPYFLITSAILDKNNKIFLKDAFAMPIFSTSLLMPLESNYERTILKILLSSTRKYISLTIEKPLLSLLDECNNRYRPDFIIRHPNGNTIFIEVLGSKDDNYILNKKIMSNIYQKNCTYFLSVKAYNLKDEYNIFVPRLAQALSNLNNG